ncbi:hypothetical protein EDB84DRAFT_1439936 [Lactarius hengduanensis]|nr:hypothetical protein EDB84DRAFT_1439936 [Lactarius hengduanensis]
MPSVPPNLPSPASSNQVLSVLHTESRHPIVATAAPSASPRPTSAPDLGAAAEDDGSRKPGLRKDKDAVDPPSVNRAIHGNTMSTPYPPPESPSQPSVTDSDVVITGRSPRGPLAIPERTGDHPPHSSQPDHRASLQYSIYIAMVDEWDKVDGSVHSPLPRSLCVRDSTHDIHQTSPFEFSFANIYQVLDDPRAYVQRLEMDMLNQDHHRHRVSEASDDLQARPVDPLLALFKHERQTIDRPLNKVPKSDHRTRSVMYEVHRTLASSSRNASVSRKRRRCMACGEEGEFGGEKSGVHDVNESETIAAVELGRSPQHIEGRTIGSSSVARAFVPGESTGHGFNSVTRAFLGETFGMHHGQCPRLDILKYDETSLLRKIIKIETLDHPGPKATVKSIRRKVHSHFPDLGLPNEMYPANWVICVLRKARLSTHYSSGCDSGGCDSDTDTTKPNNIASTSLTSTSSTTATRLVQLSDPITLWCLQHSQHVPPS